MSRLSERVRIQVVTIRIMYIQSDYLNILSAHPFFMLNHMYFYGFWFNKNVCVTKLLFIFFN